MSSEWDNVKRVAEPAGLKFWGYHPILDDGGEVWFYARDHGRGVGVGRGDTLLQPIEAPSQGRVDERASLYDLKGQRFVDVERRGEEVVVLRGLLNGAFHMAAADEPIDAIVARYEAVGFRRGFGWNPNSTRSTERVYVDARHKRTVRVDGATVSFYDSATRERETHEAADRDAAIDKAEDLIHGWRQEGFRLRLVEEFRAHEPNPRPAWEPEPVERVRPVKNWVEWSAPARSVQYSTDDLARAQQEAPPSLIQVGPELEVLAACTGAAIDAGDLLSSLNPWQIRDVVLLAHLIAEKAAAEEPTVLAGDWKVPGLTIVVGDLTVEGDVQIYGRLIVTGNLTVGGHLGQYGERPAVVLGNVQARSVYTSGSFVVGGTLQVQGAVYGYYNDEVLEVHGDLVAGAIITDEHSIVVGGEMRPRHTPSTPGAWGPVIFNDREHHDEVEALLGEENYDEDDDKWDWDFVPADF